MKRRIFLVCLFYCFLDCRTTNLLRLFSGNPPAMLTMSRDSSVVIVGASIISWSRHSSLCAWLRGNPGHSDRGHPQNQAPASVQKVRGASL